MIKFVNNQFIFNLNTLAIREIENYIKNYKIKDEKDIKDLNELVNYKESLIKGQEKLTERLQMLAEEEK